MNLTLLKLLLMTVDSKLRHIWRTWLTAAGYRAERGM